MTVLEFHCRIDADHPALAGHFPGAPVTPGVWLLDRVIAEVQAASGRRVGAVAQAKFVAALLPQERAEVRCEFDGARVAFRIRVQRGGTAVAIATGSLQMHTTPEPV
jgi:3-hydroxyacyl-[acyl-carrier-protein] dehydratase